MLFDRAFTAAPQCVPSRTAIHDRALAGGGAHGALQLAAAARQWSRCPKCCADSGYHTGVCGRYFHLDGVITPAPPPQAIYEKHGLRTWSKRVDYMDSLAPGHRRPPSFEEFLDKAPKGKPWFFWMNYSDPHHVWDANAGKVDPAKIKLPPHLPDLPGVREDLARYCGEVERADGLFAQCDGRAAPPRPGGEHLVVFMGDNGMAFPHGKGSLYDPGLNVPLMLRWPRTVKPGRTRALISGEDIAPTLIEAAGGQPAQGDDRPELPQPASRAALISRASTSSARACTTATAPSRRNSRRPHSIFPAAPAATAGSSSTTARRRWNTGRWTAAATPAGRRCWPRTGENRLKPEHERAYFQKPRPVLELFDLDKDPGELNNLAGRAEYREVQEELMLALQEKMITDYDFLPPPMAEARPRQPARKR